MFRKIRIAALSAVLGLGTLAAMPASAQADGLYFSFGSGHGVFFGQHKPNRHPAPRWVRTCTPGHAVAKAQRMGLRHARVTSATRNAIRVTGQTRRHYRESVVFGRAPHCPVIRAL